MEKFEILTDEQEKNLEKNITWNFGMIRSGTTWFATQLLQHEKNIIWNEPLLGIHLYAYGTLRESNPHRKRDEYFFSVQHENEWLYFLKKFILARTYYQFKNLSKNIIIKEPTASYVSPYIMKSFSQSKLIFILRDGRDILDSIIDSHQQKSWSGAKPFKNEDAKLEEIKRQSENWTYATLQNWEAYQNHDPNLRHFIKYEELMDDTFNQLKNTYEFLKIQVSDDYLEKQIEKFDFSKIPNDKKGSGKFNRLASPGSWQNNFNDNEKELLNSIMGDTLKKFNYKV